MGGAAAKNIAEISTTTGALVPGFKDNAAGQVETILAVDGHLLTGGFFTGISGSTADPYYASLNPGTGKNDKFLSLGISGHIQFTGVKNNSTEVYNQQLSHSGSLVEGDYQERNCAFSAISRSAILLATSYCPSTGGCASSAAATRDRPPRSAASMASSS